ncbi:SDR family NAD(P)-dependent oxidoreductase [Streptococcus dentiloxodontae]
MKNIIITGGSSGIGFEIAKLVAPKAQNIVLLARNPEKLDEASRQLQLKNMTLKVHSIRSDLSTHQGILALCQL